MEESEENEDEDYYSEFLIPLWKYNQSRSNVIEDPPQIIFLSSFLSVINENNIGNSMVTTKEKC